MVGESTIRRPSAAHAAFANVAHFIATEAGRPLAFLSALTIVLVWAATGPIFHYSDTWLLVINTGTSIVTALMVFQSALAAGAPLGNAAGGGAHAHRTTGSASAANLGLG